MRDSNNVGLANANESKDIQIQWKELRTSGKQHRSEADRERERESHRKQADRQTQADTMATSSQLRAGRRVSASRRHKKAQSNGSFASFACLLLLCTDLRPIGPAFLVHRPLLMCRSQTN